MATSYRYSIQNDFPNHVVATDSLVFSVLSSAIVNKDGAYANTEGDNCDVWFVSDLSSGDKTILDAIVAAHSGVAISQLNKELSVTCGGSANSCYTVTNTLYETIRKVVFGGVLQLNMPKLVLFNIEAVTGSGTIRLRDLTNNKTVSLKSIDTAKTYKDTSTSNWPNEEVLLAIQVKVTTSGDSVSVSEVTIGW